MVVRDFGAPKLGFGLPTGSLLARRTRASAARRHLAGAQVLHPRRYRVCLQVAPHHCLLGLGSGSGFVHWACAPRSSSPKKSLANPTVGSLPPVSRKPKQTPYSQCVHTGQRSDRLQRHTCQKKRRIGLSRKAKTSGIGRWRKCRTYRKSVAEITGGVADTLTEKFTTRNYFAVRFIKFGAWMSSLKI